MRPAENTVELIGTYGGDVTHACSAWTSTSRDLTSEKVARIPALLRQLAHRDVSNWDDPRHTSPFEKSALHFLIRCDKATHIHIIKHRIGVSVNAESARYRELREDDYLYPDDWPTEEEDPVLRDSYRYACTEAIVSYHRLVELYTEWRFKKEMASLDTTGMPAAARAALEDDVRRAARRRAKETARFVLPHAAMINQDVMFNFLSFMHFVHLRADKHAQREVRLLAARMMLLVASAGPAFDASFEAFGWGRERRRNLYTELGIQV